MKKLLESMQMPFILWIVLIGVLFSRLGTSMVLPYITIFLVEQKHLELYWPGLVIAMSYFMQSISATCGIGLFKAYSPIKIIQKFSYLYALTFILLGLVVIFLKAKLAIALSAFACFVVMGLCRSFIETTGQGLISELAAPEQKVFIFSLRYLFINIGTMLGPIIGLVSGVLNTPKVFFIAAMMVLMYAILFSYKSLHNKVMLSKDAMNDVRFSESLKIFIHDRKLYHFIIANIFIYIGFAQMEVLFALFTFVYTHQHNVFAIMYVINGLTIVCFQLALVEWSKKFNIYLILSLGICLLSCGLLIVAEASWYHTDLLYYIGAFIFTLGEIFTLALLGIYIDLIAPPEERYAYFGISNFALIGRILGPILSGIICYFWGLRVGLISLAFITLIAIYFILASQRAAKTEQIIK